MSGEGDVMIYFFAHCPERVLPGQILKELTQNNRIVGGINTEDTKVAKDFYSKFVDGEILTTTARVAEMSKLVENSFRDVNIAFANEISMLAEDYEINPFELIKIANMHPRVNILNPGVGVGGHCIAVDPWFLISQKPNLTDLIRSGRNINISKSSWVIEMINKDVDSFFKRNNRTPLVGLLGITFKPDIDDLRESPALSIAQKLQKKLM